MMKTMKMQFKYLCVAALALVGALTTGCSSDEPDLDVVMPPAASDSVSLNTPLTLEAKEAGAQVTFTFSDRKASGVVEYSTDGTSWSTYTGGTPITLNSVGDKVMFRSNCAKYDQSNISCDKDCYVYGNVMSLISPTDFATATELTEIYTFRDLFKKNMHIVNHDSKPLSLPATTLTIGCYAYMFEGCTNLETAPALPATKLYDYCYQSMFGGCNKLTTAPDLPATKLANHCYQKMFKYCWSLCTAPSTLPATKLAIGCYESMFQNCGSLQTAPALPATKLDHYCYQSMFEGCDKLSSVTCLATDITANNCLRDWLKEAGGRSYDEKTLHVKSGQPTDKSYWNVPDNWSVVDDQ